MEVRYKMVVKLGERIGEPVEHDFGVGGFGQYRCVVPPFGKVSAW